jgi:hypothetical protein
VFVELIPLLKERTLLITVARASHIDPKHGQHFRKKIRWCSTAGEP